MNLNLARPYGQTCSPPQRPDLFFYSTGAEDLLFSTGEQIEIHCQPGTRAMSLSWTLARNEFTTPFREGRGEPTPSNGFVIRLEPAALHPGLYDLRVTYDTGAGDPQTGVCVFGWQVEDMATAKTLPEDFREFWQCARDEVNALPLDAKEESEGRIFSREEIDAYNLQCAALPANYDPEGVVCESVYSQKVSFAAPGGGRVYGWTAQPSGESAPGSLPAMLVLPGAGFDARPRPLEHARHGYFALDIQVHGQDVCLDSYPRLPGYYEDREASDPKKEYFYRVHQRVLQAINFLASRPEVDSERIVVVGGSQGGRLTTVAAGLDERVKAAVPCITHFGNQPYHAWALRCNEEKQDGMDRAEPELSGTDAERLAAYYDPMNFAAHIGCPVLMNAGLIDPVSRAGHVFGVYNAIPAQKQMVALPGLAHCWSAEFDRRAWRWLQEVI